MADELRPYLDLLRSPEFQQLVAALEGPARARLEAEVERLFGQRAPTLGELLASGQMTQDQVLEELLRAGISLPDALALIAQGRLDIPTLTFPGEIAGAFGPRGGIRHLSGPYALALAIAMQNLQRNAALLHDRALQEAAQMATQAIAASTRPGGGVGGEVGERPPLPPFPVPPRPEGPPAWAPLAGPIASLAGVLGVEWLRDYFARRREAEREAREARARVPDAALERAAERIEDLVRAPGAYPWESYLQAAERIEDLVRGVPPEAWVPWEAAGAPAPAAAPWEPTAWAPWEMAGTPATPELTWATDVLPTPDLYEPPQVFGWPDTTVHVGPPTTPTANDLWGDSWGSAPTAPAADPWAAFSDWLDLTGPVTSAPGADLGDFAGWVDLTGPPAPADDAWLWQTWT